MRRILPSKRFLLAIAFAIPAILPIATRGYFPIHDNTQVVRVAQMTQSLSDGHFPVRWTKDLGYGYGYPIFNFYNPLPYYFGALINLVGFNALIATKAMFALPVFIAAITMFLLARKYFGNLGGLMASVFYTYAPYHAVQIYVRGSVAEYWAYAILPLVVYFLFEKKWIAAGFATGLLILSHNLTALMAIAPTGLIFLIQIFQAKKKSLLAAGLPLYAAIALGLSAFFWLPAALEKQFTSVDAMVNQQFNPSDHFVFPLQLWHSPWGFAGSAPGEHDGLSFELGKVHVALAALAVLFFAITWPKKRKSNAVILFAFLLLTFSLFMMLPVSLLAWQNIRLLDFIQFPWRFLAFAALSTSILAGFAGQQVYRFIKSKIKISTKTLLITSFFLLLIAFVAFGAKTYFQPQFKFAEDVNATTLLAEERIKFTVSSLSDEYRPAGSTRPQSYSSISTGRYEIELEEGENAAVLADKTQLLTLRTSLQRPKSLAFNIYSFPGWQILIDGEEVDWGELTPNKLIQVNLPSGDHTVTAIFQNTPVRSIANLISLTTVVYLSILKSKKTKALYE